MMTTSFSSSEIVPRYVEAYPRLVVRDAFAGLANGRTHVTWYDAFGEIVGQAHVRDAGDKALLVVAAIAAQEYLGGYSGGRTFAVTRHGSSLDNQQPLFVCQDCAAMVTSMVFGPAGWSCTKCSGLKNRSALLSERARFTEEADRIVRQIGRGRPVRMRQKRYQNLVDRLAQLRVWLDGKRLSAGAAYQFRIVAQWAKPEPE